MNHMPTMSERQLESALTLLGYSGPVAVHENPQTSAVTAMYMMYNLPFIPPEQMLYYSVTVPVEALSYPPAKLDRVLKLEVDSARMKMTDHIRFILDYGFDTYQSLQVKPDPLAEMADHRDANPL